MAIESRHGRHFGTCWTAIFRTKSPNASMTSSMTSADGHVRTSGFFDLVKLGTASSLAVSLLIVCGQVLADITGPSVIISILVAAAAALCSSKSFFFSLFNFYLKICLSMIFTFRVRNMCNFMRDIEH